MDNFIVSARKYRPASFDMVVGQDAITQTLKRAILTKHLAQAYLFCGPRGVGKTTCARIFAKTINCTNLSADAEACNECESCMSYNSSRSYNIHELDAASNNKVEDIRNLTDQVRIPPQVGKYSVYIIDEVHMLTTQAFNAFLKTLEEPPAHAIFILATTEKHKIIPTILSRCQIFDFNRIGIDDIVNRLKYVAERENVSAEEEALHVIAKKADGAMRDALSIFDQIVSLCGKDIKYKDVTNNLNVLDYEYYFKVVEATLHADVSTALLLFDDILSKGFDGYNFLTGLSSHFRDLLVSKDPATTRLLETTQSVRKLYIDQAAACSVPFLYKALDICNKADISYKTTKNQRLYVEMALIRLCSLIGLPPSSQPDEKKKSEQLQQYVKENKTQAEISPVSQDVVKQDIETPKKSDVSSKTISPQNNQHIPIENMARPAHHSRGISITNMLGVNGNVT
ncbi:MAG: DNA polymerase III subunit gamma/tau [Bacteroidales bacterium]|nr:DNA polymerase III subunit gamma/tau [Bacteroidales bacterium]